MALQPAYPASAQAYSETDRVCVSWVFRPLWARQAQAIRIIERYADCNSRLDEPFIPLPLLELHHSRLSLGKAMNPWQIHRRVHQLASIQYGLADWHHGLAFQVSQKNPSQFALFLSPALSCSSAAPFLHHVGSRTDRRMCAVDRRIGVSEQGRVRLRRVHMSRGGFLVTKNGGRRAGECNCAFTASPERGDGDPAADIRKSGSPASAERACSSRAPSGSPDARWVCCRL